MERLQTVEADPAEVAALRQLGLGRRRQPGDGSAYSKRFVDDKQVATSMGAGGFSLRLGSASKDWPNFKHNLPEIALAGHTNCGKSTLVNALAGIHPRQARRVRFLHLIMLFFAAYKSQRSCK